MMYTNKQLLQLTLPLFAEQFLIVFVGVADTFMVSYAGEAAVSGVALVDTISFLITAVLSALCTGGAVVASQYLGSGDRQKVALTGRLLLGGALLIGLVILAGVELLGAPALRLIFGNVEADVMQSARDYFRIVGFSYPFLAVYSAITALYRSQGNSMISMVSSLIVNLINVAGNFWFIRIMGLGAGGAALATALSRGVVCLLLCALVAHSGMLHDPGTVTLADCRSLTGKMLRIGVPTGVESSLFSLGKLLVQQLYASLGTVALAANAAAGALSCIATLPGGAISLAMLPVIGQAIGAGKPDEARRLGRKLLAIAYVLMLGTNLLVYIFLPQLSGLYGLTAETTAVVHDLLLWHCIFASLFYPAGFCIPAALRAAGDVRYPMVISVASMLVFRVGLSFVFVRGFGLGVVSIWMAIFVDWGFRAVLFGLRFHSNIWQKKKLL